MGATEDNPNAGTREYAELVGPRRGDDNGTVETDLGASIANLTERLEDTR